MVSHSARRSLPAGTISCSTMIVMMMASTPSLNASIRLVGTAQRKVPASAAAVTPPGPPARG